MAEKKLTAIEKNALRVFLANRDREIAVTREFSRGMAVPMGIFAISVIIVLLVPAYRVVGVLLIGYVLGMLHYHWRRLQHASKTWLVLQTVLDWDRVESLVNDEKEQ